MNVYELVTSKVIERLEEGVIPWRKCWTSGPAKSLTAGCANTGKTKQPKKTLFCLASGIPARLTFCKEFCESADRSFKARLSCGDGGLSEFFCSFAPGCPTWPDFQTTEDADMKIFEVDGAIDTTDQEARIRLVFPERVDHVALGGFLNDHQITYRFHFESIDGKVWDAVVMRTNEQVRWIPQVRAVGFQL